MKRVIFCFLGVHSNFEDLLFHVEIQIFQIETRVEGQHFKLAHLETITIEEWIEISSITKPYLNYVLF